MARTLTRRTRRTRSDAGRPRDRNEILLPQIVWVLALDGDINENHAGGQATSTLNERLRSRGVQADAKDVYNRMYTLERRGWVQRLTENRRCYAIRLKVDPEESGPNPFEGSRRSRSVTSVDFDLPVAVHSNGHRNGSDSRGEVPVATAICRHCLQGVYLATDEDWKHMGSRETPCFDITPEANPMPFSESWVS